MTVAELILPPGYTTRPPDREDAPTLTALIGACELADVGSVEISEEDVVGDWNRPGVDLKSDGLVVLAPDGTPAAYAEVFAARAEGSVLPLHRGRGIGSGLAGWIERRAREQGASFVRQVVPASAPARVELLRAAGYEHADTAYALSIPLADATLDVAPVAGIELRDFRPGEDDERAWRVIEDAFSAWPSREPTTLDSWRATTIDRASFEPWLFPLAVAGDDVVGAAFCIDYPQEGEGWIHQVAVRADQRGRGVGGALLREAFRRFAERGRTKAGLATDTRTGALDLYLHVGMRVTREYAGMRRDL